MNAPNSNCHSQNLPPDVRSHGACRRRGAVRGIVALWFDDQGQVTLLSAMMCFLATVFAIIALNTNAAINNRITAQNAVDAAASSAALWQARGCNVLQSLNNLHYTVDRVAGVMEIGAAVACLLAELPFATKPPLCAACGRMPEIDHAQQTFNIAVTNIQQVIADVTPLVAFLKANASAKGSGAQSVAGAVAQASAQWLSLLGIEMPSGLFDGDSALAGIGLDSIPLYAVPLDPASLDLHVHLTEGKSFPWVLNKRVGEIGNAAGESACGGEYSMSVQQELAKGWNGEWGWNDSYFKGNPGYMTWLAGTTEKPHLLAHLLERDGVVFAWLKGGQENMDSLTMFSGSGDSPHPGYSRPMKIPAYVAIASSQVQGQPVIGHGSVDAKGKLIRVFLPQEKDTYPEGQTIGILH